MFKDLLNAEGYLANGYLSIRNQATGATRRAPVVAGACDHQLQPGHKYDITFYEVDRYGRPQERWRQINVMRSDCGDGYIDQLGNYCYTESAV